MASHDFTNLPQLRPCTAAGGCPGLLAHAVLAEARSFEATWKKLRADRVPPRDRLFICAMGLFSEQPLGRKTGRGPAKWPGAGNGRCATAVQGSQPAAPSVARTTFRGGLAGPRRAGIPFDGPAHPERHRFLRGVLVLRGLRFLAATSRSLSPSSTHKLRTMLSELPEVRHPRLRHAVCSPTSKPCTSTAATTMRRPRRGWVAAANTLAGTPYRSRIADRQRSAKDQPPQCPHRRRNATVSARSAPVTPSRRPSSMSAFAIQLRRHDSEIRRSFAISAPGFARSRARAHALTKLWWNPREPSGSPLLIHRGSVRGRGHRDSDRLPRTIRGTRTEGRQREWAGFGDIEALAVVDAEVS